MSTISQFNKSQTKKNIALYTQHPTENKFDVEKFWVNSCLHNPLLGIKSLFILLDLRKVTIKRKTNKKTKK